MKKLVFFFVITVSMIHAQMHQSNDSLKTITVEGISIVKDTLNHQSYYIDTDSDGIANYELDFGPFWYTPDSSDAVRPNNGDQIKIKGNLTENMYSDYKMIFVEEINDLFWKDFYRGDWNSHGMGNMGNGKHHGDSITIKTVSGNIYIDSTFYMSRYFIDTDLDSIPDYQLNFGPPWYEPISGISKPNDGENVEVKIGIRENTMDIPMAIVIELNGSLWFDVDTNNTHFGGNWITKNMMGQKEITSMYDSLDKMIVHEGWSGGNMGGMMNLDSLYCEVMEVLPESLTDMNGINPIAAYKISMMTPDGKDMMNDEKNGMGGNSGKMQFGNNVDLSFHMNEMQMGEMGNGNMSEVKLFVYDDSNKLWVKQTAEFNKTTSSINISTSEISGLILVGVDNVTSVEENVIEAPISFTLNQNYPNPFNPTTNITFNLNIKTSVKLNIYNVLGEKVATLLDKELSAGNYNVKFDASNFTSGIYFYELNTGNESKVRKMNLIK